jgi:chloride channel 7
VASIFTTDLLWTGFLCSFGSFFVTIIVTYVIFQEGEEFSTHGLFYVGEFRQWQIVEIPFFMVLGVLMGLLGALFNVLNVHLINGYFRKKFTKINKRRQMAEVIVLALVVSSVWFFLPRIVPCLSKEEQFPLDKDSDMKEHVHSLWCDADEQYNPLASLMFASLEDTVKYLYRESDSTQGSHYAFPTWVVFVYSVLFWGLSCFIAGGGIATGIFIPMIVIGAGFGRTYGEVMQYIFPVLVNGGFDAAAYAVVGSAGFIGGVTRIAVAMAVIMLEISGKIELLLPIMLATGIAKLVGDQLTPPLYDMILEMRHAPFLEPEETVAFKQLRCHHVMQRPVRSFTAMMRLDEIREMLTSCAHNGFPVVESRENPRLMGMMTRAHTEIILRNLEFFLDDMNNDDMLRRADLTEKLGNHYFAMHKGIAGLADDALGELTEEQLDNLLDLHHWMNATPVTIHQGCLMDRAFQFFKTYGLRQLPVVDSQNRLVGILTRHDLFHLQHHPGDYQRQAVQQHEAELLVRRNRQLTVQRSRSRNLSSPTSSPTQTSSESPTSPGPLPHGLTHELLDPTTRNLSKRAAPAFPTIRADSRNF